jgi:hypothetical protein
MRASLAEPSGLEPLLVLPNLRLPTGYLSDSVKVPCCAAISDLRPGVTCTASASAVSVSDTDTGTNTLGRCTATG